MWSTSWLETKEPEPAVQLQQAQGTRRKAAASARGALHGRSYVAAASSRFYYYQSSTYTNSSDLLMWAYMEKLGNVNILPVAGLSTFHMLSLDIRIEIWHEPM